MSQQYPPQYPQQPGTGPQPPYPRKKMGVGAKIGIGCGGIFGLFVILGILGSIVTGSSDSASSDTKADKSSTSSRNSSGGEKAKAAGGDDKPKATKKRGVTFTVEGTAPAGALGGLDIGYGSDSDTRKGTFANGRFTATLPFDGDAMYYALTAQLQGSGDITCSVTVNGHTKKGHASGGYNICDAQLSSGLFGDWS